MKFDFVDSKNEQIMLQTAYDAITSIPGGWEFMKTPNINSFMYDTPPEILSLINDAIIKLYNGHSGASYGYTMQV